MKMTEQHDNHVIRYGVMKKLEDALLSNPEWVENGKRLARLMMEVACFHDTLTPVHLRQHDAHVEARVAWMCGGYHG